MGRVYARPLPLWRPVVVAGGAFALDTEFNFARPAHIRVDGDIRVERLEPDRHATT
jgi:hypothetical protein